MRRALRLIVLPAALGLLLSACAPATRYQVKPTKKEEPALPSAKSSPSRSLPSDLAWMPPDPALERNAVAIEFVHEETNPAEWGKLKSFWTLTQAPRPQQAAALFGLPPLLQGTVVTATVPVVKIK